MKQDGDQAGEGRAEIQASRCLSSQLNFVTCWRHTMKINVNSGAAIAAAAAALLIAGSAVSAPLQMAAEGAMGHCVGANGCKGKSACKTANNACKGQNGCKGKGFLAMTMEECAKIEGAKFEPMKS